MSENKKLDQLAVDAIRILTADSVQKANSGHPGMAMGSATLAYELWANHMQHNPKDPQWLNRDRFILSAGHASMLLYSLLHLFDYGLTMDDLKDFRQWDSRTPGHPEYGHTTGVEATTGPLGQGLSMGVGMAMAQAHLASRFNRPGYDIFDHYVYILAGDGCMMEGITSEASSLAATLELDRLIVFYDDNEISIEGDTDVAFTEDVGQRYAAYGWQVLHVADGNDSAGLARAIEQAKAEKTKPSIIIVETDIGYGSPLAGQAKTHGEPLGVDNVAKTRQLIGWPLEEPFAVPGELTDYLAEKVKVLGQAQAKWDELLAAYGEEFPQEAAELADCLEQKMPDLMNDEEFWQFSGAQATRVTSGTCLNRLNQLLPNLFGGSADLAPSTKTELVDQGWFQADNYAGKNIHFGVREHAMAAISNGIALYGGLRPFCATFFVFSDYLKGGLRMSALMELPVIYVLTHDSIGVGEDGPTHEPIEHLAALRSMPGVTVFRPADGKETAAAYVHALQSAGPTCLVLTRQNLPTYEDTGPAALKGGYVLADATDPEIILLASGSEVELAMAAKEELAGRGIQARVVSMPSMELFEKQSAAYKESVLPGKIRQRLAIEAGATMPWYRYVGLDGKVVGIDRFGASAPAATLFKEFGFSVENVTAQALALLGK